MKVKICGIQSVEAALYAVDEGADALGFVFAPSKRKISSAQARNIIQKLPPHVWKVGVFVNESPENIVEIADRTGITHIQLHGEEDSSLYKEQGRELIKSLSVHTMDDVEKMNDVEADYILLDSPPGLYKGGSGKSFNWELASGLEASSKVILAGGLNPQNVHKAIHTIRPFMVDVSSGVESDGEKDLTKISAFIKEAKRQERMRRDEN